MRAALAPINPTIGDLAGNAQRIERAVAQAMALPGGADLVVLPELAICGYPPRDLLSEPGFVRACTDRAMALAPLSAGGPTIVLGCPLAEGPGVRNALLVFQGGRLVATYAKRLLPTYDVFDEQRYFLPGRSPAVVEVAGVPVGLAICEDLWTGQDAGEHWRYQGQGEPIAELVAQGARAIVAPSASPFVQGKHARHVALLASSARRHGAWVLSVNQAGANDDLIFDGHALAFDPAGRLRAAGGRFEPALAVAELDRPDGPTVQDPMAAGDAQETLACALAQSIADYVRKTGFQRVLVGLSGGIDSAVTAALAVKALGHRAVVGVAMPGPFSSDHALQDARDLADRLGIELLTVPILGSVQAMAQALGPALDRLGQPGLGQQRPDLAEENLQSRLRGAALMALSNRLDALVLTTGNKSELAVGYCTLYGDMNGALAPLGDVPKMGVYALARAMNARPGAMGFASPPIPRRTIDKPPSAELAPGQRDQDTLPPYDVLDAIVQLRVEQRLDARAIATQTGQPQAMVERLCRLIARNEYKRSQYAVVPKVSPVAFGPGRRMPIAQAWTGTMHPCAPSVGPTSPSP
ncbi:MAG: NAD+ synthase [Phycisphaerales bacterium]|nr:MAG: NAD+ synthase [Phycisphaerales bacterium]